MPKYKIGELVRVKGFDGVYTVLYIASARQVSYIHNQNCEDYPCKHYIYDLGMMRTLMEMYLLPYQPALKIWKKLCAF